MCEKIVTVMCTCRHKTSKWFRSP